MQNMSKNSWCGALFLVIALWWAAPLPVYATPFTAAVEYVTSSFSHELIPGTYGYQFSTSVPFNVNALAYWVGGAGNTHQVGLWDSGGTLLVSSTILNTDPIQDHFQYHSIPTFTLSPGAYTIGGEYFVSQVPAVALGVVTVPGFTWTTGELARGAGLNYPTEDQFGTFGQNGILVANFSITRASAVPEPSTLLLLGSALVGLAVWRRKHAA